MSLSSKIAAIQKYKAENPKATYDDIKDRFQCSYGTISRALHPSAEPDMGDPIEQIIALESGHKVPHLPTRAMIVIHWDKVPNWIWLRLLSLKAVEIQ